MAWMSRHFAAKAHAVVSSSFECASCGFRGSARVRGEGEGEGIAPYLLGSTAAAHRAVNEAERKARVDADRLLGIVPCPRCRARDRRRVRAFLARALARAVLPTAIAVAVLVAGVVLNIIALAGLGVPVVAASLVFGSVGGARYWKQWRTARARVEVTPLPPP